MPITTLAGRTVTVTRRTAILLDASPLDAAPGSVTLTRQPASNAFVQVTVAGAAAYGTLTVNGDVGGVPTSTLLAWSANGAKLTTSRFDAGTITSIDRAGWGGTGTFTVESVGSDGAPEHTSYTVVTGWPARFDRSRGKWQMPAAGGMEHESTRVYIDYTDAWTPREGDVLTDERTSEQFFVVGHPELHGGGVPVPHHWEIDVVRREGSTTT